MQPAYRQDLGPQGARFSPASLARWATRPTSERSNAPLLPKRGSGRGKALQSEIFSLRQDAILVRAWENYSLITAAGSPKRVGRARNVKT